MPRVPRGIEGKYDRQPSGLTEEISESTGGSHLLGRID